MRRSALFLPFYLLAAVLLLYTVIDAYGLRQALAGALEEKRRYVAELRLTDFCLFTEARYTRHYSQADLHTAFQDSPLSLDHFPSGSLLLPTPLITNYYEQLAREAAVSD